MVSAPLFTINHVVLFGLISATTRHAKWMELTVPHYFSLAVTVLYFSSTWKTMQWQTVVKRRCRHLVSLHLSSSLVCSCVCQDEQRRTNYTTSLPESNFPSQTSSNPSESCSLLLELHCCTFSKPNVCKTTCRLSWLTDPGALLLSLWSQWQLLLCVSLSLEVMKCLCW